MKTNRIHTGSALARIVALIFVVILLSQCRGPKGDNGIDGIHYTHSAIYDVNASGWTGDTNGYSATLNVPEITDDIYYNGAVLVYRLIETDPKSFNMLPYTYVDNSDAIYFDYDAFVGSIDLLYKVMWNGVNSTPAPESKMSFKVVIIEGISLDGLNKIIDTKNFTAVTSFLDLDRYPVK